MPADRSAHDIVIVGAGMVGAAAACILARAGFSVAVLESREPADFDPEAPVGLRVSAISPGSADVLAAAGVWQHISDQRHCAYRRMHVEDRTEAVAVDFVAAEFGLERLGTIVENTLAQSALWNGLNSLAGCVLKCPAIITSIEFEASHGTVRLDDGTAVHGRIVVGADGADSAVRKALGIGIDFWSYGQQGVVCNVQTQRSNAGLAWQRFLDGGPVAFLPLADGTSSIVWSCPDAQAEQLLQLDDDAFCAELQHVVAHRQADSDAPFGDILACGPRAAFPLKMQLSETYAVGRGVLIGDAAHVVHPLAGQGVNMGFMDAAALVESLLKARRQGKPIDDPAVLESFARWRRSEAEIMAHGINRLRSFFMPAMLGPLRRFGLGFVARSWTLKDLFIQRAAGRNREAPALARGTELNELLS